MLILVCKCFVRFEASDESSIEYSVLSGHLRVGASSYCFVVCPWLQMYVSRSCALRNSDEPVNCMAELKWSLSALNGPVQLLLKRGTDKANLYFSKR